MVVQPRDSANRVLLAFLNAARAAAPMPISAAEFAGLQEHMHHVLEAFEHPPEEPGAFLEALKHTMPALLNVVAGCFDEARSAVLSKTKADFIELLRTTQRVQAQADVALELKVRLPAFVEALSAAHRDRRNHELQKQLLEAQLKVAASVGHGSQVMQESSRPNRRVGRGICFSWDGHMCHAGPHCTFDHPPGVPSTVHSAKMGRGAGIHRGKPFRR